VIVIGLIVVLVGADAVLGGVLFATSASAAVVGFALAAWTWVWSMVFLAAVVRGSRR
jgi:hypothetical protein